MDERITRSLTGRRFSTLLLGLFRVIALTLAPSASTASSLAR